MNSYSVKRKCKAEGAPPFKKFWKRDNWKSTSTPQFGNKVPKDAGESHLYDISSKWQHKSLLHG